MWNAITSTVSSLFGGSAEEIDVSPLPALHSALTLRTPARWQLTSSCSELLL